MSKTKKTKEELLAALKKANKQYKAKMAEAAGFDSVETYAEYLAGKKANTAKKVSKSKPIIHTILIVDNSGSMCGAKIKAANQGVNQEISELKKIDDALMLLSIVSFSGDMKEEVFKENAKTCDFKANWRGTHSTNLYGTLVQVLRNAYDNRGNNEKILVKIFTDGQDTDSTTHTKALARQLIADAKNHSCTVTFVGTEWDTNRVIQEMNIDKTNTLVHDNTAQSVMNSFTTSTRASKAYVKAVAAGASDLELQTGFYGKKLGKL